MAKKKLRVGFDLDGIILYNPIRIFRPLASFLKPFFIKKKKNGFYFPKSSIEQFFWKILHKTSYKVATGVEDIKQLVSEGKIEAYIITARYGFLKTEFDEWIDKLCAKEYFTGCYYNKKNEQPNIFKEKMIKKLDLDVFVEDNWGIIKRLNGKKHVVGKTKIFWVTNLFDQHITYQYKFKNLKEVAKYLRE